MQKGIIVALVAMLAGSLFVHPLCAQIDSTLTVDEVIYTNAVFGTVTPYAVTVKHSTGVASVPLERLPADLQRRFGYDPQKAQDYLQESTVRQAALVASDRQESAVRSGHEHEAAVKAALVALTAEISGEVIVTTNDGMMLRTRNAISYTRSQYTRDVAVEVGGDRVARTTMTETEYAFLVGYPGLLAPKTGVRCLAYPDGSKEIDGHTMPRWVYQSDGMAFLHAPRDDR
jgi:hypothetical protein